MEGQPHVRSGLTAFIMAVMLASPIVIIAEGHRSARVESLTRVLDDCPDDWGAHDRPANGIDLVALDVAERNIDGRAHLVFRLTAAGGYDDEAPTPWWQYVMFTFMHHGRRVTTALQTDSYTNDRPSFFVKAGMPANVSMTQNASDEHGAPDAGRYSIEVSYPHRSLRLENGTKIAGFEIVSGFGGVNADAMGYGRQGHYEHELYLPCENTSDADPIEGVPGRGYEIERTDYVPSNVNAKPIADFTWTPERPVAGRPMKFLDTSRDPDGWIQAHSWNFGDGGRFGLENGEPAPSHTYAEPGVYNVTFRVVDDQGSISEPRSRMLVVHASPLWTEALALPQFPRTNEPVEFRGRYGPVSAGPIGWSWDLGDGTTASSQNVSHAYSTRGDYLVNVSVTNATGAAAWSNFAVSVRDAPAIAFALQVEGVNASVDASATTVDNGTILRYTWTWSDGTITAGRRSFHEFSGPGNHSVTLSVVDDHGLTSQLTRTIALDPLAPLVDFDAGPSVTRLGEEIRFADHSSPRQGVLNRRHWDFGDGEESDEPAPSHVFASAGQYVVTLSVTDSFGITAEASKVLRIAAPPTSLVTVNVEGLTASVDGSRSRDADGAIVAHTWRWGDGSPPSREPNATHKYFREGRFVISHEVMDDDNMTATTNSVVELSARPLELSLAIDPSTGIAGAPLSFQARWTSQDVPVAMWNWNFGDGRTDAGATAEHAYSEAGTYGVQLTIQDALGRTATQQAEIIVGPLLEPTSAATVTDPTAAPPQEGTHVVPSISSAAFVGLIIAAAICTITARFRR